MNFKDEEESDEELAEDDQENILMSE